MCALVKYDTTGIIAYLSFMRTTRKCVRRLFECKLNDRGLPLHMILDTTIRVWESHLWYTYWMKKCFYLIEHIIAGPNPYHMEPLVSGSINLFKREIYDYIRHDLVSAILLQISKDRNGKMVSRFRIKKVIKVLNDIGVSYPKLKYIKERNVVRLEYAENDVEYTNHVRDRYFS